MQPSLFHAPRADLQAVAIEEKNLHAISSLVHEKKQMTTLRVLLKLANHQSIEAIESKPHIGLAGGHEDARDRAQTQHELRRLKHCDQPPQRICIKSRVDADPATTGEFDR